MKRLLTLSFLLGLFTICTAQEFSFKINFIDAAGNKDSLILGYDPVGTDSLDPLFGELNIISTPHTIGLDVRTANIWSQSNLWYQYGQTLYESKTQIVPKACNNGNFWTISPIVELNIESSHFPITAYWDKNIFNMVCNSGSLFTAWSPIGWWDVGPVGFREVMSSNGSKLFNKSAHFYVNGTDTSFVYWIAMQDSSLLGLSINEPISVNKSISVYPNPSSKVITLSVNKSFGDIAMVEIYNNLGQQVLTSTILENISVATISSGFYYIQIVNESGQKACIKFQKN